MDNVVQNISITDIIPSDYHPNNEEKRKIEELSILIKQFGLLDPILVRPKDNKYEIIMGNDKYNAALIASQKMVPVIIREIDDEVYTKYSNIDKTTNAITNDFTKKNVSNQEKNTDIVNLKDLSKIKLEYERDDFKMNNVNNEMINNNPMQPEMQKQNDMPSFGGRFFPSLEDEPTNMNMMGGMNQQPVPPIAPQVNNDLNNNLIDLTDLSLEKETNSNLIPNFGTRINDDEEEGNNGSPMTIPSFGTPVMPTINEPTMPNLNSPEIPKFNIPDLNSMPNNGNIINLENLQNNNPAVQPMNESASMEILNADFGAPNPMPNPNFGAPMENTPEFNETLNINQPTFVEPQTFNQPNFGINQPPVEPLNTMIQLQQSMPSFDINLNQPMYGNFDNVPPMEPSNNNMASTKDVTPVTNTIKNLANSLSSFGFKINVNEEDLPNMAKITIEVEK